jgi:hypothetical protein
MGSPFESRPSCCGANLSERSPQGPGPGARAWLLEFRSGPFRPKRSGLKTSTPGLPGPSPLTVRNPLDCTRTVRSTSGHHLNGAKTAGHYPAVGPLSPCRLRPPSCRRSIRRVRSKHHRSVRRAKRRARHCEMISTPLDSLHRGYELLPLVSDRPSGSFPGGRQPALRTSRRSRAECRFRKATS